MDELRREYIIPVHLNPAEMIDCSYLDNRKSKSRAGSTPYASKRKKKRKKVKQNNYGSKIKGRG